LAQRAAAAGRMGIDTEFMGEGRYRPELFLIQIATPLDGAGDEGDVTVLDPLEPGFDPSPLARILADPAIEIVLHAGRQDVALLRRIWNTDLHNIFDTQVAAGFAGLRAQLGYEGLLREILGLRLEKSASFTRWDQRPLSAEQISYAREDVLHLLALAERLQERLAAQGRLQWAREECAYLEDINDDRDIDVLFAKLPRINSLDPGRRAIARELVGWRESVAQEEDRPASTVLQDVTLVEIAKRRPASRERLTQIRGLNEGTLRRRGPALLAAIERGREQPPIAVVGDRPAHPDAQDAPVIALAEALVRARALEAQLAYELLASRSDLQRIVLAIRDGEPEPEVRTLTGWRRELIGGELLALLKGERTLTVDHGRVAIADGS
jgi:ribonuclease D